MRDIYQVLRETEHRIVRVRGEIEALRSVIHLLAEEGDAPLGEAPAASTAGEGRDMFLPAQGDRRQ